MPMNDMQFLAAYGKFDKSVLVSAGAGSGKTQVLTSRVTNIIKEGTSPLNLLVLTFTNAAAAEMKDRVRQMLVKEGKLDVVSLLEQSYITTFDSFNLSICKKYAYALNISPNIGVCDSDTMRKKKIDILTEILNDLYLKKDASLFEYLDKFTEKKDDSLITNLLELINALDKKEDSISFLENYDSIYYTPSFIEKLGADYLASLNSDFKELNKLLLEIKEMTYKEENRLKIAEIISYFDNPSFENYELVLNSSLPRSSKNDSEGRKELGEKFRDKKDKIKKKFFYHSVDELKEEYIMSKNTVVFLRHILLTYYKKMNEFMDEFNVYEFNDIQKMAIKLVRENEEIRNELKTRFKEILIDEYQDTSDLQEIFINYFANNNCFMVGDIKQSIYRFRNANPNIFKNKYETYYSINKDNYPSKKDEFKASPGYLIDMNQNFRSRSEVLEDINNMFSLLMSSEVGDANYKESHQMQFGLTLYNNGVKQEDGFNSTLITYPFNKDLKLGEEYYEAYIIAKDIMAKMNSNYQVYSKQDGFRPITYNDFCIILDRERNMQVFSQVLEYYKIPTVIYSDKKIGDSYTTMLIINLCKLVALSYKLKNSIDEYEEKEYFHALTSILRSPLYEYSDDYICEIVANRLYTSDASKKAFGLAKKIDQIANKELYEAILQEFAFYENIIKFGSVNESLHEAEFLYNKIDNLSNLAYTFTDIASYLADLIVSDIDVKYSLDTKDSNGVKMMNIHKSKGLEFPVCYFSDFTHNFNQSDMKKNLGLDNEYGIYVPVYNDGIRPTFIKDIVSRRVLKETISERLRLFYVALTRAREKMIFIRNETKVKEASTPDEHKSFGDYFDYLLEKAPNIFKNVCELDENYFTPMFLASYGYSASELGLNSHKPLDYHKLIVLKDEIEEANASKKLNEIIDDDKKHKLEIGTKFHELFEYLDFSHIEDSVAKLNLAPYQKKMISKVLDLEVFKNIQNAKTYPEHEFMFLNDDKMIHGIIDLLVEYENHYDIIDYKLKNLDDEMYDKQLNAYAAYVKSKTDKEVNCYLVSLLDAKIRKVDIK